MLLSNRLCDTPVKLEDEVSLKEYHNSLTPAAVF